MIYIDKMIIFFYKMFYGFHGGRRAIVGQQSSLRGKGGVR